MPDKTRMFLLFLAAGAGVLLLYSAYKDKSPTSLLSNYAGTSGSTPVPSHNPNSGPPQHGGSNFRSNHHGMISDVPSGYPDGAPFVPGNML